jgi:hypothetical protein
VLPPLPSVQHKARAPLLLLALQAEGEADAVFKRLVDEVHSGQAPEVLTQAVKDGILVNIRCGWVWVRVCGERGSVVSTGGNGSGVRALFAQLV